MDIGSRMDGKMKTEEERRGECVMRKVDLYSLRMTVGLMCTANAGIENDVIRRKYRDTYGAK